MFSEFCTARLFRIRIRLRIACFRQSKSCSGSIRNLIRSATYQPAATLRLAILTLRTDSRHFFSTYSEPYFVLKAAPPLEAILVIFGRRALIFFGKKWKLTPLLCACAVVITLETQKCRKRAPRSVEFHFFINCDRHKRFSLNESRRADLHKIASNFLIFA